MTSQRRATRSIRQTRRRRWLIGGGITVVLAATATALLATGVVALPGESSAAPDRVRKPTPSSSTTTRSSPPVSRRDLTVADPLRLWIAGDSLAGSLGPSLGDLTAKTGVVQPEYDSRPSSGLMNPDYFDWPEHVTEQLRQIDPEVVVFVIGTNDANAWSPRLAEEYRLDTESMMKKLAAGDRQVYWVGPPVARSATLEKGAVAVGLIARTAAAKIDGVTYVDAHALFSDASGEYQQSFADQTGRRRVMRAGDGIHFSAEGADFLAAELFTRLDRGWRILAQADLTQPKRVRETEGSTQVPGTHRSIPVQSGGTAPSRSSSGSTSTTTTIAPAPSTTTTTTTTASTTTTTAPVVPPGP